MKKVITAYHGSEEFIRNLLSGEKLKRKSFDPLALPGDLGTGTYFFIDNPMLAYDFVDKFERGRRINVIECVIEVEEDEILDFNQDEASDMFFQLREQAIEHAKKKFPNLKGNRDSIDGIIIDLLVKSILEMDKKVIKMVVKDTYTPTLNYSYMKGKRHFFGSNFANGTELCLRDVNLVKKGVHFNGI
ncbi:hypothetical protein [Planococcus soli]|uniref:hypothetical protein n=1 Tax=Planococcus soli TaxID=2666072 RepID=UPI00115C4CC3|nr:hypothetical protein [Planococcus soli]